MADAKRRRTSGLTGGTHAQVVDFDQNKGYRVRLSGKTYESDEFLDAAACDPELLAAFEAVKGTPQVAVAATPAAAAAPDIPPEQPRRRAAAASAQQPVGDPEVKELDIPSVPEFFPTAAQFADPLAYVESIYAQASLYGVAVINPPKDAWDITVSIDKWDGPAFLCKRQKLLQAQRKNGDPGFDYFKKELTLKEYEVQTRKEEAKLLKTLPRQFDLKNERDVETMFLDTIARQAGNQSVVYGNDVEGTLLDHDEKMRDNSWCPMKIALEPNCPIRALGDDCPGITRPYMYFGMLFTFFAWHTEDNDLYSINYMHSGKAKTWYAVPDHGADGFERVMREKYPEFQKRMPDLHYRKCLMMSPQHLVDANVPVYRAVQHENQIVITFPKAYHGGFSHGFNCAESSNFALPSWLSYGSDSAEKYREASLDTMMKTRKKYGRDTVILVDSLLWDICAGDDQVFPAPVVEAATKVLVPRLRRELLDREAIRAHQEPAINPADLQDSEASDEAGGGDVAEYAVEALTGQRFNEEAGCDEWEVKWVGFSMSVNTWEPRENLCPSMVEEYTARVSGGTAQRASKKRPNVPAAATGDAAAAKPAAGAAAAEPPETEKQLESISERRLSEGDTDWDLNGERCFICRHPCFFTGVISKDASAVTTFNPMAAEGDTAGMDVAEDGAAGVEEEEIPLMSCLSPQCLSYLPGKLHQLEQLTFHHDGEMSELLKRLDPSESIKALPSFHPEFKLCKNPRKRVGNSSGEPTIMKSTEQKAILDVWWAKRVTGRDMSATFVDVAEKNRLAEEIGSGFTTKKVDYWLWGQRKKFKKEHELTDDETQKQKAKQLGESSGKKAKRK